MYPFFVNSQCNDYKIISQGSVATQLRCGGISSNHFITNFPQNVPVQNSFQNRSIFDEYMDNCLQLTFMGHLVHVISSTNMPILFAET